MLTTSFPVWEGSSSGIFVERLARRLGMACDLSVLAPSPDTPLINSSDRKYKLWTFRYAPFKWQILAHGGGGIPATIEARPWTLLLLPLFLGSMFINCFWYSRKADLIFANWSICGLVAGFVGGITGKPVCTTIRGEDANRATISRVHRLIIKLCLKMNKRIFAVSDDIAMGLSLQFPAMANKILMIPNGVDQITKRRWTAETNKQSNEVNIVMVGSLIVRKDVSTALRALSLLPKEFKLTIIGDGPEFNNLLSLCQELHLKSRVRFEGHVHPEKIVSYLENSDVFLITSKSEGRPNALLEACARGIPAIGSDIPGINEIIISGVNGMLFSVGNYIALSDVLFPFTDQSLRHRLGDKGRLLIEERGLTWEITVHKYMEQFRKICC